MSAPEPSPAPPQLVPNEDGAPRGKLGHMHDSMNKGMTTALSSISDVGGALVGVTGKATGAVTGAAGATMDLVSNAGGAAVDLTVGLTGAALALIPSSFEPYVKVKYRRHPNQPMAKIGRTKYAVLKNIGETTKYTGMDNTFSFPVPDTVDADDADAVVLQVMAHNKITSNTFVGLSQFNLARLRNQPRGQKIQVSAWVKNMGHRRGSIVFTVSLENKPSASCEHTSSDVLLGSEKQSNTACVVEVLETSDLDDPTQTKHNPTELKTAANPRAMIMCAPKRCPLLLAGPLTQAGERQGAAHAGGLPARRYALLQPRHRRLVLRRGRQPHRRLRRRAARERDGPRQHHEI